MKNAKIRDLILLAFFADIGFVSKRVIAPFANVFTDFLRVPGGIGTSFSLLFLVIGACAVRRKGAATVMSLVQCILAMSLGMTGAMGVMSPLGYIVPGIVIDLTLAFCAVSNAGLPVSMLSANAAGSLTAALTANFIVFNLHGAVLALYVLIALISGGLCGLLAAVIYKRIRPLYGMEKGERNEQKV
ncbi:MAG: ECF transporter S component [Solobacterium sp.]|nr:ECF transporter S component [Solobacterium sp.]